MTLNHFNEYIFKIFKDFFKNYNLIIVLYYFLETYHSTTDFQEVMWSWIFSHVATADQMRFVSSAIHYCYGLTIQWDVVKLWWLSDKTNFGSTQHGIDWIGKQTINIFFHAWLYCLANWFCDSSYMGHYILSGCAVGLPPLKMYRPYILLKMYLPYINRYIFAIKSSV